MKVVTITEKQIQAAMEKGLATPPRPGTYQKLPNRTYVNVETGEITTRRRIENALHGATFEQRVKLHRALGLPEGPGRGRKGVPRVISWSPVTMKVYHPRKDATVTVIISESQFKRPIEWWAANSRTAFATGQTLTDRVAYGPDVVSGTHSYQIRIVYEDENGQKRYIQTVQASSVDLAWQLAEDLLFSYLDQFPDREQQMIGIQLMHVVIAA